MGRSSQSELQELRRECEQLREQFRQCDESRQQLEEALSAAVTRAEMVRAEGEARYRSFLENTVGGFAYHRVELDEAGRPVDYVFLDANEAFERLTGLRREEILGRRATEVMPGIRDGAFDWVAAYGEVALTGEPMRFDQYLSPLGRWYSVSAYSLRRGYFAIAFVDITERKKSEIEREHLVAELQRADEAMRGLKQEMLAYQEQTRAAEEDRRRVGDSLSRHQRILDAIFDNILAQVAYLDPDFNFVRVNAAYAAGSGHAAEELIGRNHFDLFPNEENRRIFEHVRDTGEPYVARAKAFTFADQPERGVTYWDWWLRAIKGPRGEPEGVVLSLVDVTETERARREVERLNAEMNDASAAKDQFLAILSHELRNPLSPILAGVELAQHLTAGDERTQRVLETVSRNAKLQARLVNDLFDLSRISRGKTQLQRGPLQLGRVVAAVVRGHQADAERGEVKLTVDAEEGLWIDGDADRLQQVVANLLSNALKFTPAGGAIRVSCRGEGARHARLVVEDTGVGIDAGLLGQLFEIFRQGELGGRSPGLGIGLALVRSLTEMHGGRVWAESEGAGKGSRFVVELPLIPAPTSASAEAPRAAAAGTIDLLLVEDNPDTCFLLSESLAALGYKVTTAASAEAALECLAGGRPDLILSDIALPGMSGYELLRTVRATEGLADVPAFAISGFGQQEDVRRARAAGFVGHFVKPVDVAALDCRIREYLGLACD